MKPLIIKISIAIFSVFVAGALWMGIATGLFKSNQFPLPLIAVYISHFSFIGWLIFGNLSILLYRGVSNQIFKLLKFNTGDYGLRNSMGLKAIIAISSVFTACLVWLGFIAFLSRIDSPILKYFAPAISQLYIVGWLGIGWSIFGLLSILFYSLGLKYFTDRAKNGVSSDKSP